MITRGDASGVVPEPWSLGLSSTAARRLLNLTLVVVVAALLLNVGEPEFLLDALWVTLAISAFVLGMRPTVVRMATVIVLIEGFASADIGLAQPVESELSDITEWPLMIVVSTIVALMADRVSTMARRYASLYRLASNRLTTAHEDERARLARDLHDGVGQTLTAVVLTLDAAESGLRSPGASPDAVVAAAELAVRRARDLTVAALDEAREVAAQLRPPRLHEIGLGAAIADLANSAGIPVEIRFEPSLLPPGLIEAQRELDAFRVIQEALGNAARHSGASRVRIEAEIVDRSVAIRVIDNGHGFDPASVRVGLGLPGMHDRAAILFGSLVVSSDASEGTVVELTLPILGSRRPNPTPVVGVHAAEVRP
jgi:two-component system sensor histidine kinase UhpB